jgi:hypothetical protein
LTAAEYREAIALCRTAVYAHESYDGDSTIAGSFLGQLRVLLDAANGRAERERIKRIRQRPPDFVTAPPASERERRDAADAHRGEVVPGSATPVEGRRFD